MTTDFITCPNCNRTGISRRAKDCPSCQRKIWHCPRCHKLIAPNEKIVTYEGNSWITPWHYECIEPLFHPPRELLRCQDCGAELPLSWYEKYFSLSQMDFGQKSSMPLPCPACGTPEASHWLRKHSKCDRCLFPVLWFQGGVRVVEGGSNANGVVIHEYCSSKDNTVQETYDSWKWAEFKRSSKSQPGLTVDKVEEKTRRSQVFVALVLMVVVSLAAWLLFSPDSVRRHLRFSDQASPKRIDHRDADAKRSVELFFVQIGAYGTEAEALYAAQLAKSYGVQANVMYVMGSKPYRVRIGPFATISLASVAQKQAKHNGLSAIILRVSQ